VFAISSAIKDTFIQYFQKFYSFRSFLLYFELQQLSILPNSKMESREHIIEVPKWTLILRIASLVLAIIILGLDSYGIHYYAFDKLIFSLVTCLLTFIVIIYMIVATLAIPKAYNMWAFLALDILMVIFWLIDFALVGSLAAAFAGGTESVYAYYYYWWKRDISKRDTTTYDAYYGALVAGAVFGAFNFVIFVVNLVILGIGLNKHRLAATPTGAPPGYNNGVAAPTEKYGNNVQPSLEQPQQMPQQPQALNHPQYAQPQQPQYTQPQYAQPQQTQGPQFTTPYTQPADPVNRQQTISPLVSELGQSQPAYGGNPNAVELQSPQHTGNPHAAELGAAGYK